MVTEPVGMLQAVDAVVETGEAADVMEVVEAVDAMVEAVGEDVVVVEAVAES